MISPSYTTPQATSHCTSRLELLTISPSRLGHLPITALATAPIALVAVTLIGFEAVATGAAVVVSGTMSNEAALVTPLLEITSPVGDKLRVWPPMVCAGPPTESVVPSTTAVLPLSG